ncbi:hypothetical protein ABAC460_05145 [Asticcacaulis sp. AC460]|uniref:hypothetical protein n=1 Tax=Asticcacaulis sp. AC460 TaxID=1282360 RepID=UPI0003C3C6FA|nr:hypothetical protein [Asticcacaulis sp. AC460]ESQ91727.1 hypothetical protein ABAC460_05145 [Asticcacaulis sp. AC460]
MRLDIEFAFEGFRIIRKQPLAVAAWGLVFLVANIVGFGALIFFALPTFVQLFSMSAAPDPAVMSGLMLSLIPPYLIMFVVIGVSGAVVSCAVFRAALTDEKPGFGYLRFGGDELRMILIHIIYVLLFLGVYAALAIVGVALGAGFSLIDEDLMPLGVLIAIVAIIAGIGLMIWLMIRLSLFSVQSFDEKRINLFGSWKLTKGNFWSLFGGYLLAWLLAVVVETVVMTVVWFFLIMLMFANMGAWQQMANSSTPPDVASILWAVGPMMAGYIAIFSLVAWPMMIAIMVGAPAAAYRTLSGRHPRAVEKIF